MLFFLLFLFNQKRFLLFGVILAEPILQISVWRTQSVPESFSHFCQKLSERRFRNFYPVDSIHFSTSRTKKIGIDRRRRWTDDEVTAANCQTLLLLLISLALLQLMAGRKNRHFKIASKIARIWSVLETRLTWLHFRLHPNIFRL